MLTGAGLHHIAITVSWDFMGFFMEFFTGLSNVQNPIQRLIIWGTYRISSSIMGILWESPS